MEQADRYRTGQKANQAGKRNQPQIMLVAQAIQDLVHNRPLFRACNHHGNGAFGVSAGNIIRAW